MLKHLNKESEDNLQKLRTKIAMNTGMSEAEVGELITMKEECIRELTCHFIRSIRKDLRIVLGDRNIDKQLVSIIGVHVMLNTGINLLLEAKDLGFPEKSIRKAFESAMAVKDDDATVMYGTIEDD